MRTARPLASALSLLLLAPAACARPQRDASREPVPAAAAAAAAASQAVLRPVQGQLDAYNAHDLERFLSHYASDVRLHAIGPDSTSVVVGKDAMRRAYEFLRRAPAGFRAEIVSRSVAGRYVIDHERVLRPGQPTVEAVAIYEVADGAIVRVWFLPDP